MSFTTFRAGSTDNPTRSWVLHNPRTASEAVTVFYQTDRDPPCAYRLGKRASGFHEGPLAAKKYSHLVESHYRVSEGLKSYFLVVSS